VLSNSDELHWIFSARMTSSQRLSQFCLDFNFRLCICDSFQLILFLWKNHIAKSLSKLLCYQFLMWKKRFYLILFYNSEKTVCTSLWKK
jgi:hypothetical protein